MKRLFNRTGQLVVDLAIFALAFALSYFVRFEGNIPAEQLRTLVWTLPYVVAIQYAALVLFGVHRVAWRYITLPDIRAIGAAVVASATLLLVLRAVTGILAPKFPLLLRAIVPVGVTVTDATFAFLGVAGARVLRRMLAERNEATVRVREAGPRIPTLLIGAGRAGMLVAKEIANRPDLGILPVGFLDDDPVKRGLMIHGVPVLGPTKDLAEVASARGAKQVLITIAAASGKEIRRFVHACEGVGIPVKIIPALFEIVGGQFNLSRIREVAIEDLLRREPITLEEDLISRSLEGRTVLVTGAGGSIGSELCRQIARFSPASVVLVEQAENPLFFIERELRQRFPNVDFVACIADICETARMDQVFRAHRPSVVFHAAAHKHVPLMEANPAEAIKNNVLGTRGLCDLADAHGVREFVLISTDKAVNPTSVMGASKRAAELYLQALSNQSGTRFVAVRFGNVLGSAGSVVPIFKEQIAKGGPVTVTDPEMKRYFMTIPEACQLVLQAGAMGEGGEIFVLDMGEPVKIVDLARDLIRLSGLREGIDIELSFTGVRPGEKLFEELSLVDEGSERTRHPKVYIGRIRSQSMDAVLASLAELEAAAKTGEGASVRGALARMIPEYQPATKPTYSSLLPAEHSQPTVIVATGTH